MGWQEEFESWWRISGLNGYSKTDAAGIARDAYTAASIAAEIKLRGKDQKINELQDVIDRLGEVLR